jgi:hypothetical protein
MNEDIYKIIGKAEKFFEDAEYIFQGKDLKSN